MSRTDTEAVQGILGNNYDDCTELTPFIEGASLIVARVVTCATAKGITLSSAEQEMLERYLAAHLYGHQNQFLTSKSTGGASGSFQGQTGMHLEATYYGQTAMNLLDPSGCLAAMNKRQTAGGFWAGKPPTEQTPYRDRR